MPWIAYFIIKMEKAWIQALIVACGVVGSMALNYWIISYNGMAAALFAP